MTGPTESASPDLLIIGGGIHGCAAAFFAAKRGMSVTVLEKDSVARHASGVNAGGVRRLGRDFAEVPISVRSMEIWHEIGSLLDDETGFQIAPQIKVAENEPELAKLSERAEALEMQGFRHEVLLTALSCANYFRRLPITPGGLACLDDGFAQPFWATTAFRRKAEKLGARFIEHVAAERIEQDGTGWLVTTASGIIRASKLLVCAGAWSGALAAQLGEDAPVRGIAPLMIVTARLPHFCDAVVGAAGRPLSFKQMPNGTVVIGGGRRGIADPARNRSEILFSQLNLTAETAISLFPIMAEATIIRSWSGIEGCMPDEIPVIGPSKRHEGIFYAFGFSARGSSWACRWRNDVRADCHGRDPDRPDHIAIDRFENHRRSQGGQQ